jgi:hypothetical protein
VVVLAGVGCPILIPQHHTEGTLAEEPAVESDLADTGAEIRDESGGTLVNQYVLRWGDYVSVERAASVSR